jgi:cytochrome c biogenesis factor
MNQYYVIKTLRLIFITLFVISAIAFLYFFLEYQNRNTFKEIGEIIQEIIKIIQGQIENILEPIQKKVEPPEPPSTFGLNVSTFTLVFTALGTVSTLILGWRNEKRIIKETKLKIEKLELELTELKSKEEEKKKPKIHLK